MRDVLNPTETHLETVPGKGRGVFATHAIPAQTVIQVSPVLLVTKDEADTPSSTTTRSSGETVGWHSRSLFNQAEIPNVSFSIDPVRECIVYTSTRTIQPDEELRVFYGHDSVDGPARPHSADDTTDPWGGLVHIQHMDDIVQEPDLPFTWKKLALEKEEERLDDVELVQAWVVDIPDPKHIATMLRWLKQSGLDTDALSHLKRIRRQGSLSTLLLDIVPSPPPLPPSPHLGPAYQVPVPQHPARTPTSLALKNTYWPTVFCPKRKWEPEPWTRAKVLWATAAVGRLKRAYATHCHTNEIPIVAHVPVAYTDSTQQQLSKPFFAYDTRTTTRHPLRHAAFDIIRQLGDYRAQQPGTNERVENGAQYLLTGLTLFITHEPCLMCTMALLHSRVKEVFYLVPMPKTGGCGGIACVPSLKGVNHRFSIAVWKRDEDAGDWPDALNTDVDV